MTKVGGSNALERIAAAIDRIEQAARHGDIGGDARAVAGAAPDADDILAARHARLRQDLTVALGQIDALLAEHARPTPAIPK